jgi:two-component system chemotaxis response regulator CheB
MARVVILDRSVGARRSLRALLEAERDLEVLREFSDPTEATRFLLRASVELLIIDEDLLAEGGLDTIEALMLQRPLPILILSVGEPHEEQSPLLQAALVRGALSIEARVSGADPQSGVLLRSAVRRLMRVPVMQRQSSHSQNNHSQNSHSQSSQRSLGPRPSAVSQRPSSVSLRPSSVSLRPSAVTERTEPSGKVIAPLAQITQQVEVVGIGASAGGPGVVADILSALPTDYAACILVVQHLPAGFAEPFADYLRARIRLPVGVCGSSQPLLPGHVILAPDDAHLLLGRRGVAQTDQSEPLHGHRPSVDLMLSSVARHYGERAAGVILSGIGRDGATGLRAVREAGGLTISQDGESAAVYGMPRVASESGAAEYVLRPSEIVDALLVAVAGVREAGGRGY